MDSNIPVTPAARVVKDVNDQTETTTDDPQHGLTANMYTVDRIVNHSEQNFKI